MKNRRKKVAFFSKDLDYGGIEKVFVDYANYLSHENDVSFILCKKRGGLLSLLDSRIEIYELEKEQLKEALFSLVKVLRRNKFDVIISGSESCNILLVLAKKLAMSKSKIITSQHSYFNSDTSRLTHDFLLPWALKKSSCTICVSNGIKDMLVGMHLNPDKLKVLHNPIDRERIISLSQADSVDCGEYIVFVGRMYAVKNIPFLIKSFKIFQERNPGYKLVLVGDGPDTEKLKHYADELVATGNLIWTGATSNPYPYILLSQLLVLSSISEALPTVILEALCLGKTVVSTPCAGSVELLQAPTYGYIANTFDDCEEFATLMEYAIRHKKPIELLTEYSKESDVGVSALKLEQLISDITKQS